jgi:hypothetical protein
MSLLKHINTLLELVTVLASFMIKMHAITARSASFVIKMQTLKMTLLSWRCWFWEHWWISLKLKIAEKNNVSVY